MDLFSSLCSGDLMWLDWYVIRWPSFNIFKSISIYYSTTLQILTKLHKGMIPGCGLIKFGPMHMYVTGAKNRLLKWVLKKSSLKLQGLELSYFVYDIIFNMILYLNCSNYAPWFLAQCICRWQELTKDF